MVNTFVVSRDLHESASHLDTPRLRKQCVEAYQILRILQALENISILEKWSIPTEVTKEEETLPSSQQASLYLSRVDWVTSTRKRYLALPYRYARINNKYYKFPQDKLPFRVYKPVKYHEISSKQVVIEFTPTQLKKVTVPSFFKPHDFPNSNPKNTYFVCSRTKVILPEDELYTLGFSQHAIVRMWVGYTSALAHYINVHIDAYCSRTSKNGTKFTMSIPKQQIRGKVVLPWWITKTNVVIYSHKASLLRKEYDRTEPDWYINKPCFTSIPPEWKDSGYVWTGSFPEQRKHIVTQLIDGNDLSPSQVSAPLPKSNLSQPQLRRKYNYNGPHLLNQDGYVVVELQSP